MGLTEPGVRAQRCTLFVVGFTRRRWHAMLCAVPLMAGNDWHDVAHLLVVGECMWQRI